MFLKLSEFVLLAGFVWILTRPKLDFCLMNSFITALPEFPPAPITRRDGPIVHLVGTSLDV